MCFIFNYSISKATSSKWFVSFYILQYLMLIFTIAYVRFLEIVINIRTMDIANALKEILLCMNLLENILKLMKI